MSPLWTHQQAALSFVEDRWNRGRRGALLDIIMGGGKSRVAIELVQRHRLSPVLILCPLRVVEVWRTQFALYAPDYEVVALDDRLDTVAAKTALTRERLAWSAARGRPLAIAINYQSACRAPFARWAVGHTWPLVIGDELHKIKQADGSTSRFVGRLGLCAHRRLGLTGTPMPHSPLDVWAQFRFLDRTIYDPTYTAFRLRYAVMDPFFKSKVKEWRDLDELRAKFFSITFQVGDEVLDLPGEQDQTLYCRLGEKARAAYQAMEEELVAWIEANRVITAANALVRLLRLQQITSGVVTDNAGAVAVIDHTKRQLLEELLEDLASDEPVVVFAVFKSDLAAIHQAARTLGRPSGELSGTRDDLSSWQRGGPGDPLILAVQIQAGGVGIDLTRGRYGVYYSTGFNLGDYLQSRARLVRPGQMRPVMFYHLAATGTVDETIASALERRQDLIDSVLKEYRKCHQPLTTVS